ncbi:MAG: choice-of-anchor Q domain-containing protein [Myxococcota bacterium]
MNWVNNRDGVEQTIDQIAVVECDANLDGTGTTAGITAYNSGNRMAFMGNYFDGGGLQHRYDHLGDEILNPYDGAPLVGSHVTRFPYCYKCVVSHNDLRRPGGTRHHIKLHAPFRRHSDGLPNNDNPDPEHGGGSSWSNYSVAGNLSAYTEQVIIADNHMVSADAPWDIAVSPQDAAEDERLRDIILERNWHEGITAGHQISQVIRARQVTSRNNLATDIAGAYTAMIMVDVDGGEPPASDVWIYSNTMYKANAGAAGADGFAIVSMPDIEVSNVTIQNNLGYAPNATGPVPYFDAGITGLTASSNSTTAQITASPLFAGTADPTGFVPGAGSYAIDAGATVPVWSDFFGTSRPQNGTPDLGAVEGP